MPEKPNEDPVVTITPEEAGKLVVEANTAWLDLSHLTELDVASAKILINHEGVLVLGGLTSLDPRLLEILAEYKYSLTLDGLTQLDVPTAEALAKFSGDSLSLRGLTQLDVLTAEALARCTGNHLNLDGLTQLDVPTAKALAGFRGRVIYLNALRQLDVPTAEALARYVGEDLSLDGLTQLDVPTAEALAGFGGGALYLNALTQLDVPTAEALAKFKGDYFFLCGLTQLDGSTAKALAKFTGCSMFLDGLTEIDVSFAELFADYDLSLGSVRYLDKPIAEVFTASNSHLVLNARVQLSQGAKVALKPKYQSGKISGTRNTEAEVGLLDELLSAQVNFQECSDIERRPELAHWRPLLEKKPNFKDTVVKEGAEIIQYLRENEVENPERFHNFNAGRNAEAVIAETLDFIHSQSNGFSFDAFSEHFKRCTKRGFENNPEFLAIYLDETLQVIYDHLNHQINSLRMRLKSTSDVSAADRIAFLEGKVNDPQIREKVKRRYRRDLERLLNKNTQAPTAEAEAEIKRCEELLVELESFHLKREGQVSYQLGARSTSDLTWGDRCSDCTSAKIGGMNFWTVPVWATDPGFNFLLQYDEEGKLAHKFGLVWQLKAGKGRKQVPILTIDSLELANEQKAQPGMSEGPADSKKEARLMQDAMSFIRQWVADMGLDPKALYASMVSNTGTMELDQKYPRRTVRIAKLGALDASRRILRKSNPDFDGSLSVYLQSLVAQEGGQGPQNEEGDAVAEHVLEDGDRAQQFAQVEGRFDELLQSDSGDASKVRGILELARTDASEAARQMRIFLVTQAQNETKEALSVNGRRIDVFLHACGHGLEAYLKSMYGQTEVSKGMFTKSKLFHVV